MDAITDEALAKRKVRVVEIAEEFERQGLSPRSLSDFEHKLHESLGEFGRRAETAVLEAADVETGAIEYGGSRHYWKYKGPQEYQCIFGKIEVRRSVYQANGERTVCPLEVDAGIVHHHLTPPAAEFVAYSTALMVPGEVEKSCQKWQYLKPCETVIKQAAAEVGEMAEVLQEQYEQDVHKLEGPAPQGTNIISFSRDGCRRNLSILRRRLFLDTPKLRMISAWVHAALEQSWAVNMRKDRRSSSPWRKTGWTPQK